MIKNISRIVSLILICTIFVSSAAVNAEEIYRTDELIYVEEEIGGLKLLDYSHSRKVENGKEIRTMTAQYEEGITVMETITTDFVRARATSGTQQASKVKTINGETALIMETTLKATFEWDSTNKTSRCTSATTDRYVNSNFTVNEWTVTTGYYHILGIPTGSSFACLDYGLYLTKSPSTRHTGELNIKCSYNGGIS